MNNKTITIVGSAILLIVLSILVGCAAAKSATSPQATATPGMDAVSAGVQLLQQDMVLKLTQQYVENERIETGAKMTATQQVLDVQATTTERAHQEEATKAAAAYTREAWQVTVDAGQTKQAIDYANATSTVHASETQQAIAYSLATETAQAQATSNSVKSTQDTTDWNLHATQQAAEAESAKLAAERERMTNGVTAWGPWVGFAIALFAAIYFARKYLRVRAFKPDPRGDAPYLVIDGKQIVDLDAMPGALLDLPSRTAPLLTSPENTANIKARDQFIDLNTRGLPNQFQERKPTSQMPLIGQGPRVEIAPYADIQRLLGDAEQQLSDEEVK